MKCRFCGDKIKVSDVLFYKSECDPCHEAKLRIERENKQEIEDNWDEIVEKHKKYIKEYEKKQKKETPNVTNKKPSS